MIKSCNDYENELNENLEKLKKLKKKIKKLKKDKKLLKYKINKNKQTYYNCLDQFN